MCDFFQIFDDFEKFLYLNEKLYFCAVSVISSKSVALSANEIGALSVLANQRAIAWNQLEIFTKSNY